MGDVDDRAFHSDTQRAISYGSGAAIQRRERTTAETRLKVEVRVIHMRWVAATVNQAGIVGKVYVSASARACRGVAAAGAASQQRPLAERHDVGPTALLFRGRPTAAPMFAVAQTLARFQRSLSCEFLW